MARILRHRQTKGAETDRPILTPRQRRCWDHFFRVSCPMSASGSAYTREMAKPRPRSSDESDAFSVADLKSAIESFDAADSLRLGKAGRYLGWKCQTDGDELLSEAIMRALNGDRRCPKDVSVVRFLVGVMKSLTSEFIEKRNTDPLTQQSSNSLHAPLGSLACHLDERPNPEEALEVVRQEEAMEALVHDIEALFVGDDEALRVLRGQMNELSPEEVRRQGLMDQSTYNTARRRIRRRIDKEFPNGWSR